MSTTVDVLLDQDLSSAESNESEDSEDTFLLQSGLQKGLYLDEY